MDKVKKGKIYALIAAILFAVYTILSFYIKGQSIIAELQYSSELGISIDFDYLYYIIWNVLFCISLVLITVALFCKSKKFLIVGAAAIMSLNMINLIYGLISFLTVRLSFEALITNGIIDILTIAAYVVLIFLTVQSLGKSESIVKVLWFLPSLIVLICYLMYYIILILEYATYYGDNLLEHFKPFLGIERIALIIAEVSALLFIGIWLKASAPPAPVKADIPLLGGADKLKEYKRLLDSGAISKDEFDEKKRQILDL